MEEIRWKIYEVSIVETYEQKDHKALPRSYSTEQFVLARTIEEAKKVSGEDKNTPEYKRNVLAREFEISCFKLTLENLIKDPHPRVLFIKSVKPIIS